MRIAITGGAGYVGSQLVPHLLKQNHEVTVLDTFWFGDHLPDHHKLKKIKGDIRSGRDLWRAFDGQQAIIHLACVSNDPSFELNPSLGKSINYDAFQGILKAVKESGAVKFIYASSSSVYGINEEGETTEATKCNPITDYSKYKRACEIALANYGCGRAEWTILRPATVCGYSPRLRLDVVVNAMTATALWEKKIYINGGRQLRPNINIKDMVRAYETVLDVGAPGETFNVGYENLSLSSIAWLIEETIAKRPMEVITSETNDERSYHVNSERIKKVLNFTPTHTIIGAVNSLVTAKSLHLIKDPKLSTYSNIKRMKELMSESPL